MSVVRLSCPSHLRVLVVVVGSELEVDVLALADALEVGLLVVGDVVVADIQARQCPDVVRRISAKVGQGIFWIFLHLLALGDGSSNCFRPFRGRCEVPIARAVIAIILVRATKPSLADIQTRQRPNGRSDISKGGTGDILALTGTWGGKPPQ